MISTGSFIDKCSFTTTRSVSPRSTTPPHMVSWLGVAEVRTEYMQKGAAEGQHPEMQVLLLSCRQRRHEVDGNQKYFKEEQNYW